MHWYHEVETNQNTTGQRTAKVEEVLVPYKSITSLGIATSSAKPEWRHDEVAKQEAKLMTIGVSTEIQHLGALFKMQEKHHTE